MYWNIFLPKEALNCLSKIPVFLLSLTPTNLLQEPLQLNHPQLKLLTAALKQPLTFQKAV